MIGQTLKGGQATSADKCRLSRAATQRGTDHRRNKRRFRRGL
jgi:hypothetical protein